MSDEFAEVRSYHDEVVQALRVIGDPRLGLAIQADRGSQLEHLGVRFPALRKRVKQGFSFTALPADEVLHIWDALWHMSPYGDVLFAALEYHMPRSHTDSAKDVWPVVRHWIDRVDNWCHSDNLSAIYSRLLEQVFPAVYPQLQIWNGADSEWLRRISIVSLIHYTGKNAVFLTPERVLPMVTNCLTDHRHNVEMAVGWVLREMGHVYPSEITAYLEAHGPTMSAPAFSRAIERRTPDERTRLRAGRNRAT